MDGSLAWVAADGARQWGMPRRGQTKADGLPGEGEYTLPLHRYPRVRHDPPVAAPSDHLLPLRVERKSSKHVVEALMSWTVVVVVMVVVVDGDGLLYSDNCCCCCCWWWWWCSKGDNIM